MIETLILGAPPAALQLAATLTQRRRAVQILPTTADMLPVVDAAYVHSAEMDDGYSLLSQDPALRFDPDDATDLDTAYRNYLDGYAAAFRLEIAATGEVTAIVAADGGFAVACADGRRFQAQMLVVATAPDSGVWATALAAAQDDAGGWPQTGGWESARVPGLFFAGTLMAHRRSGDTAAALPGSLRYPARTLGYLLTERGDRFAVWPSSAYTNTPVQLTETLLSRARDAAALRWQAGYLVDVLSRRPGERAARLYRELPAGLVAARYGSREQTFRLSGVRGSAALFQLDHALHGNVVAGYQGDAAAEDAAPALRTFLTAEMRRARP